MDGSVWSQLITSRRENLGQHNVIIMGLLPEATEETSYCRTTTPTPCKRPSRNTRVNSGAILEPVAHDIGPCAAGRRLSPESPGYYRRARSTAHFRRNNLTITDDIRFSAVAPGVVLTSGVEHVLQREAKAVPDRETADRQIRDPEEIANLVQLLASPTSSDITREVVSTRGVPQSPTLNPISLRS